MGPATEAPDGRYHSRVSIVVGLENREQARSNIMRTSILLAPFAAILCLTSGCGPADALRAHTGENCVAHIRRDYLGMASTVPLPIGTTNMNGAEMAIQGKLKNVDAHWLTIETAGKTPKDWVVPREALLTVSFDVGKASSSSD